jgi:phospholipid-transporting ATPase
MLRKSSTHDHDDSQEMNKPMMEGVVADGDVGPMRELSMVDRNRNRLRRFCDNSVTTSKYSLLPFSLHFVLYKNLFEQFQKAANVYFLAISCMQVVPGLSPTGQYTTLIPLLIVVSLSLIKDFWEDLKRRTQDAIVNSSTAVVLRNDAWTNVEWREVEVGDLVKVTKGKPFPADLVSIWSSEQDGNTYIETANLDGETNLKLRKSVQGIFTLLDRLPKDSVGAPAVSASDLSGRVVCELPNNRLYHFTGFVEREDEGGRRGARLPILADNILLRGAELRNTKVVYGIAVFTGADSKLSMNMTAMHHKRPRMDSITNQQIFFVFCFQLLLATICVIGFSINVSNAASVWYLRASDGAATSVGKSIATFLILFNSFIPISLYIMMEVVKLIQANLINNDIEMYTEESDTPAMVRNSKLNEEFGQVEFIFSDKTGTLTCNKMEFRHFSVAHNDSVGSVVKSYGTKNYTASPTAVPLVEGEDEGGNNVPRKQAFFFDSRISKGAWRTQNNTDEIRNLLEAMAVCHTVIPEAEGGQIGYQFSSPDEGCLVKAAQAMGLEMCERTEKFITVCDTNGAKPGHTRQWQVLSIVEFNSNRKRMSMVCKDPMGRCVLLVKGADNVILERLKKDPSTAVKIQQTKDILTEFANDGLRTLVFAKLDLSEEFYKRWRRKYDNVPYTDARQQKLDEVAEELEKDLELLGTTAIEDRLQDQVPETIKLLSMAGIKLWVLTGDKQETALNIGYSCMLLNKNMGLFQFDQCNATNIRQALEKYMSDVDAAALDAGQDIGLIIQGSILEHILPSGEITHAKDVNEQNADLFVSLAIKCKSVICCRVSPIQKAKIVEAVKLRVPGVTLSIGDGANDVSMIQMAHLGIGISGLEGMQAARASDCSISQFYHLQRLLLVHGRWNYRRISRLIIFSFYKNIALYMTQFWFATYNMFTGMTLYDAWALAMYNFAFTALPIMSLAVFDKDVEAKRLLSVDQFPELYQDGIKGKFFNTKEFWKYCSNALFHSLLCFFLCLYSACDLVDPAMGNTLGLQGHAIIAYSVVLHVVTIKCALEVNTWTLLNVLSFLLSIYFWYLFLFFYCSFYQFINYSDFALWYGFDEVTLEHPCYWLVLALVVFTSLARDVTYKFYRRNYDPHLFHVVQDFENKIGVFDRKRVKHETPWLFPKQELKAFKPSLSMGLGTTQLEEVTAMMDKMTTQKAFFDGQYSPGRRRVRITDIIASEEAYI